MPTSTDAPRRSFSRPAHRVDTHDACDPTAATTTHRRRCAVPCDDLAWGVMVNVQEEAPAPVDPEMEEAERKKLIDEKRREKLQYKVKLRMSAAFEKKTIPWSSVFVVAMGLLALLSHAYFNHVIRVRLPTLRAPPCLPPSIHAGSTARRLAYTWSRRQAGTAAVHVGHKDTSCSELFPTATTQYMPRYIHPWHAVRAAHVQHPTFRSSWWCEQAQRCRPF